MTEAINPTGSQGPSPPSVVFAASQAAPAQGSSKDLTGVSAPTTVASAEVQSIKNAAQASQAAKLDLSPETGVQAAKQPEVMTMQQAAEAFQSYLKSLPSDLQFQPDYQAGIVVFKVVNPVTQEVIRQLPPEQVVAQARMLRMAERTGQPGILLDKST
jgi:flagellar protein FlaG